MRQRPQGGRKPTAEAPTAASCVVFIRAVVPASGLQRDTI